MRFLFLLLGGWIAGLACAAPESALDADPNSPDSIMLTREVMQYRATPIKVMWEDAAALEFDEGLEVQ